MNLSLKQCKYLIDLAESTNSWVDVKQEGNTSYQTIKNLNVSGDIESIVKKYCSDVLGLTVTKINLGILKYKKGDAFARHFDFGTYEFNQDFIYNINVKLNDDYIGGEFYLDDEPYNKPVGELYHYKSTKYHEVKEIKSGIRYSALFYVRGRDIDINTKSII